MSDSASDSRDSGLGNFPFSEVVPIPTGDDQDTVIADVARQESSNESQFVSGDFDVTEHAAHERLSPVNPKFNPHGVCLQHFVIDSLIGSGGMGAVFKATDTTLQRTVAVKILSHHLSSDRGLVARFHNEARSCARLNHENIARIYFIGEDQGINFIAFEFVDGLNLRQLIAERNWLTPAEALNFTLQIAFALRQTSQEGVVHRDIKPSNIIVTDAGRVKLVDLGLARKSGDDSVGDLTSFGATLGTFDFIPPEQARDARSVDVRSDIYSLGCTLFNMLTGQAPYPDGTAIQKLLNRHTEDLPDASKVNPIVPEDLSDVVKQMMSIEPDARHQSADELIGDLLNIGADLGLRGINPDSLVWIQPREHNPGFLQKYSIWMTALAALLMLVAVFDVLPGQPRRPTSLVSDRDPIIEKVAAPLSGGDATTPNTPVIEGAQADPVNGGSKPDSSGGGANMALRPDSDDSVNTTTTNQSPLTSGENETEATTSTDVIPIVDDRLISLDSDSERSFQTLEAAIAEADDGDVIKLRFNGLSGFERRPVWVYDKNITIRAVPGFRPIIQFRIDEDLVDTDTENRIMTLVSGSIDLVDIDLHVHIPESPLGARWSLFSLLGTDQVRLNHVNVQFINPAAVTASVFQLSSNATTRLSQERNDGSTRDQDFSVDLADCWVSGHADLFAVTNTLPGQLDVRNSALVLEGALLKYTGSSEIDRVETGQIDLQLEHVTCLVGDSLIQTRDSDGFAPGPQRKLLPVNVTANNNIFSSLTLSPLVLMYGNSDVEEFRQLLTWNGNRNCYNRITSFWQIDSSISPDGLEDLDYDRWRGLWRNESESSDTGSVVEEDVWMTDWNGKPASEIQLSDLTLNPSSETMIGGATDGKDVGANISSLPGSVE